MDQINAAAFAKMDRAHRLSVLRHFAALVTLSGGETECDDATMAKFFADAVDEESAVLRHG